LHQVAPSCGKIKNWRAFLETWSFPPSLVIGPWTLVIPFRAAGFLLAESVFVVQLSGAFG
jgi:hypothetical protein